MAIFKDDENMTIGLNENNTDWYSLLQFCICKVNPNYYKDITVKKYHNRWELCWSSLNDSHTYSYDFPIKTKDKTIKKLAEFLPKYITVKGI